MITLDDLRRFTIAHSLFTPTTLKRAVHNLGFVQADPIRAPARAQDLTLRHRVKGYRAGDLERSYAKLGIEEDFFVTYGFVTSAVQALMHPRSDSCLPAENIDRSWPVARRRQAQLVLDFVRERGVVHPREVDEHFAHGTVTNNWGGSSNATTQLLDAMHYSGLLRVARREAGIRLYMAHQHEGGSLDPAACRGRIDALVDVIVRIYAPLPAASLSFFVRHRLRFAVPQWREELKSAFQRAKERLDHQQIDGVDWYWPAKATVANRPVPDMVRLLAPFDPVVRDRVRFELLWNWVYRFEAYTPVAKRQLGYYALPLLWRELVIGWANLAVKNGELNAEFGYLTGRPPRDRGFKRELEAELDRLRVFLGLRS